MIIKVIVTDPFPPFPGSISYGPFTAREEAEKWIEQEKATVAQVMTDGGKGITYQIVEVEN